MNFLFFLLMGSHLAKASLELLQTHLPPSVVCSDDSYEMTFHSTRLRLSGYNLMAAFSQTFSLTTQI